MGSDLPDSQIRPTDTVTTLNEVTVALEKLESNKAASTDGSRADFLKDATVDDTQRYCTA